MKQEIIKDIIDALDRVDEETTDLVISLANRKSDIDIMSEFNQLSVQVLEDLERIGKKYGCEGVCNMKHHRETLEHALKINARLPIDKFSVLILLHAAEVYNEEEKYFMELPMPDVDAKAGNKFTVIKCEPFKDVWKLLDKRDKRMVVDKTILLTTWAHAYFIKNVLSSLKK